MYCRRCHSKIKLSDKTCKKCGMKTPFRIDFIKSILVTAIIMIFVFLISYQFTNSFYHADTSYSKGTNASKQKKLSKYETIIQVDRTYHGVKISNKSDAKKVIEVDSTSQKSTCSKEIVQLEKYLINNYNITAINLCEMDYNNAYELEKVISYIYNNFPETRGYLTNITLKNMSAQDELTIASFLPTFQFATASSISTYPWVYKTQIFLNSSFFLNDSKLESTVIASSATGHFPKNSNKYSPVAHEMGHFISFVALMKHYKLNNIIKVNRTNQKTLVEIIKDYNIGTYSKQLLMEAYNDYLKDGNSKISFDLWRMTISGYAIAKDSNGKYIYDETIAEAFHDVYLNGERANIASIYIVHTLKEKLN